MFRFIIFGLVAIATVQCNLIEWDYIKYHLYTHEFRETPLEILLGFTTTDVRDDLINPSHGIKILCHGFGDTANSYWVEPTKEAYMDQNEFTVISVDWSHYAFSLYRSSVKRAKPIGEHIAELILEIHGKYGIPLENFHLIGHSLGSHISGYAGQKIISETGSKIGRITGLDPAGPAFNGNPIEERLSPDDAIFVDAIHTDMNSMGYKDSLAHADFWPNGGSSQNGCSILSNCNHLRAPIYFAETIGSNNFPSYKCNSEEEFENGDCFINEMVYMGENCVNSAEGNFYLRTNPSSPFGIPSYG